MKLRTVLGCVLLFASAPPARAQTGNVGYTFRTGQWSESGGVVPPDTTGSVGPNNVMQYNNDRVKIFNKDGTTTISTQTEPAFWIAAGLNSTLANKAFGDPRLQYDPLSQRWFAIAFTSDATNNSILIGRSNGPDLSAGWSATSFATTLGLFGDYPTMGMDANALVIGTNNFTSGGSFSNVSAFTIPKASLLAATPTVTNMTRFEGIAANTYGFTLQGVTNFTPGQSASSPSAVFAISNSAYFQSKYTPINGTANPGATLGTTTTNNWTVFNNSDPPFGRQPNSANSAQSTTTMDSLGDRYGSRVYRVGNTIYAVHGASQTISGTARAVLQITILDASGATPTVFAQTTLGEANFDYYIGSIAANERGDIVVGYTRSGYIGAGNANNRWPSSYASVGTLTGSTLSFGTPLELTTGAFYNSQTGAGVRWGDYSATNVDPSDNGIFWTFQEVGQTGGSWATWAGEVIPTKANEIRWKTAAAGAITDTTKWYNGVVPSTADHVIFSRWSTSSYTVDATGGATNDRLSIRQTGSGTLTLNIPTGATWALGNTSASTPSFNVSEFQGTSNVTVSGGGTLSTKYAQIAPASGGTANVTVTGSGTLWTNANDLNLGGTATTAGGSAVLNVLSNAAVTVGGTMRIYKNDATAIQVNVGAAGAPASLSVAGLTAGAGTPRIDLANAGSTLNVTDGLGTTYAGTVTGTGSVTKSGAGTLTLTGVNTWAGTTTVSGGTLALTGTGSFANSTTLTVGTGATLNVSGLTGGANFDTTTNQFALASGQTLRGSGTVNTGVTVRAGAGIRGDTGTGTGTLTANGTVVLQGASGTGGATLTAAVSENGSTTPDSSKLAITNNANLNLVIDSTNKLNLTLAAGAVPLVQGQLDTATLATVTGAGTIQIGGVPQAGTTLDPATYTLTQGFAIAAGYELAVDASGQALVLRFTPVPEPGAVLAVAALGLGLWQRRRFARAAR